VQQDVHVLINHTSLELQDARSLNTAALLPRHKLVPVPNRDSGAMPPANIHFTRTRAVEVPADLPAPPEQIKAQLLFILADCSVG
jgi:hypothetical protein